MILLVVAIVALCGRPASSLSSGLGARIGMTHEAATPTRRTMAPAAMRAATTPDASFDDHHSVQQLDAGAQRLTTRADWLRASGAALASSLLVLGRQQYADAASGAGGAVTVLGAGGKTGRECVEYLASRGTGEFIRKCLSHATVYVLGDYVCNTVVVNRTRSEN